MTTFGFATEGIELVRLFKDQVADRICKLAYLTPLSHKPTTTKLTQHLQVLITGPSQGGIGAETAISLAHAGPRMLLLAGRSLERIQPVIDTIHSINPSVTTKFIQTDLTSQASVRKAAQSILESPPDEIPRIDVLINNAAVMAGPLTRTPEDGHELQLAAAHLGHFTLTNHLVPKLADKARIVNVSSQGTKGGNVRFDDPNYLVRPREYVSFEAYGQAKTANVLFTIALNKRLASATRGIRSFSLHPGSVQTPLQRHIGTMDPAELQAAIKVILRDSGGAMPPTKTLQQGCATTLRAALDPDLDPAEGVFLHDCQVTTDITVVAPWALDEQGAEKLWTLSEELVGERFEW